jgi:hypothetical protein
MKRLVYTIILKILGKALLLTLVVGIAIVAIGYFNQWDSSVQYVNAFFIAGCLVIIAGASSRMTAGAGRDQFQYLYAESFRDMSSTERANLIANASSSYSQVILGFLSGFFLIAISVIILKIF